MSSDHDLDFGATLRGFAPKQRVFNRYTLQRLLGRGGMGVVWLARDEELEQEVALKFLPEVVMTDRGAMEDLKREARRSRELAHPHVVRIHDFVRDERVAAISMEYVAGDNLANRRAEQPQGVFEVGALAPWVAQTCEALEYAHTRAKVVHRDLKPANLMLNGAGEVKIADFGIARSIVDSVSRASRVGAVDGSLPYMSPQQLMGEPPAAADDVYALGATIYELLTGKPPFHSGGMAAIMAQVQSKVPPTMTERRKELGVTGAGAIPEAWEETVAACLAKDPQARPAKASEIAARLGGAREKEAPKTTAESANPSSRSSPLQSPYAAQFRLIPGLELELAYIPAGAFHMGSPPEEAGRRDDERLHVVTIAQPFWLGRTEVTQRQYELVMGCNPSQVAQAPDLPVNWVSWFDARTFCARLTEAEAGFGRLPEGYAYGLPTEAQWEYACRAGTAGPFGGDPDTIGTHAENDRSDNRDTGGYSVCGARPPNAWGLHDMHGNVEEWCFDRYGPYAPTTATDPIGAETGTNRVARGGSLLLDCNDVRSARRGGHLPTWVNGDVGFRVALVPVSLGTAEAVSPPKSAAAATTAPVAAPSGEPAPDRPAGRGRLWERAAMTAIAVGAIFVYGILRFDEHMESELGRYLLWVGWGLLALGLGVVGWRAVVASRDP